MFKNLLPDFMFGKFDDVTPEFLASQNIKYLLIDIDNTLAPYEEPMPNERVIAWFKLLEENEYIMSLKADDVDMGTGKLRVALELEPSLFYEVISEMTGMEIDDDSKLISTLSELAALRSKFERVSEELAEVEEKGYGIVMPDIDELTLKEPEIVKQGGRYGVRLSASAPSIHLMKANITTEVSPIVGSEKQSEDLIMYLLSEFEENPVKIWDSNIFGKSLHELVNEGLHTKLARMPVDARMRVQETIERVINDGCNGLVCIIL